MGYIAVGRKLLSCILGVISIGKYQSEGTKTDAPVSCLRWPIGVMPISIPFSIQTSVFHSKSRFYVPHSVFLTAACSLCASEGRASEVCSPVQSLLHAGSELGPPGRP